MLIKISDLHTFIKEISSNKNYFFKEVIAPVNNNDCTNDLSFRKIHPTDNFILEGYRSIDPLKILFYNVREKVFPLNEITFKRIVAGVKTCDLQALQLMDKALINDDFTDYAYKQWRDATYIISSDCTDIHATCNCVLVNGKPYPETGYDINLSVAGDYYLLTIGSQKGNELFSIIQKSCDVLDSINNSTFQIDENRKRITEKLATQNQEFLSRKSYEDLRFKPKEVWDESSGDCVGCGACTNICPTCYCLILNDESAGEDFIKVRGYDSCQLHGYARVAGGASPRPKIFQRFRNRYLCKFDYMKQNFGTIGCTGCGRCTETCAAKIDFRKVINYAQSYTPTT